MALLNYQNKSSALSARSNYRKYVKSVIPTNARVVEQRKVRSNCTINGYITESFVLVCPHSCDKVKSDCTSNSECKMILDEYNYECDGIIHWDGNSTMPMCTDKCKKLIEKLENSSIGKYLKCCNCDNVNIIERTQCVREKQNIAVICDVDFNHVRHCHNDQKLCANDTSTPSNKNSGNNPTIGINNYSHIALYVHAWVA